MFKYLLFQNAQNVMQIALPKMLYTRRMPYFHLSQCALIYGDLEMWDSTKSTEHIDMNIYCIVLIDVLKSDKSG